MSTKSKEILENVAKTDNKISNETVLVKNLINDFYLVGHKQFTENRVEEENEDKHYKSVEHDESFGKQSLDPDSLIHEQMKSVLDTSLKFVRQQLQDLEKESSGEPASNRQSRNRDQLNQDDQVERLIKLNRYHRKKLPPIVDSEEFMSDVFSLVKQSSMAQKSRQAARKPTDRSTVASESSSIISDLENISINERILEIHENNFVERLSSTTQQSSTSFEDVKFPTDSAKQSSKSTTATGKATTQLAVSSSRPLDFAANSLDQSQAHKRGEDKIGDSLLSDENSLRKELDAIFGKASSGAPGGSAKNRMFEDDSDDELFQPVSAQSQKATASKAKDLFGSDSDESEFDFGRVKGGQSKSANLFDSNVKSSAASDSATTTTSKPSEQRTATKPAVNEAVQSKPVKSISKKSDAPTKLFDSDSDDDELFSSRSVRTPARDQLDRSKLPSDHKPTSADKSTSKASSVEAVKAVSSETVQSKEIGPIRSDKGPAEAGKVSERIIPVKKREHSDPVREASSSSRESLFEETAKMANKKDLFKNQLEDLFAKKRNPSSGFVKVNREKEDSLSEDAEKNKDNLDSLTAATIPPTSKSSSADSINRADPIGRRKEFDLFGTKPSENLSADDLSSLNDMISTLDNNLVKSRIKFTNRKRPTKMKANTSQSIERKETAGKVSDQKMDKRKDSRLGEKDDLARKAVAKKIEATNDKSPTISSPSKSVPAKSEPAKDVSTEIAASKDASPTKATKKKELFGDSDDDEFFKQTTKPDARQNLKESLDQKFAKLFDDSDDDDQLFATSSTAKQPSPATASTNKSSPQKTTTVQTKESAEAKKKKLSSLFDDDSDDELFFQKRK